MQRLFHSHLDEAKQKRQETFSFTDESCSRKAVTNSAGALVITEEDEENK